MPSEMQERIARAIYEDRNGHGCVPWSRRDRAHKAPYLSDAIAAMKAMQDPTDGMITAGGNYILNEVDKGREIVACELFRAMLSHEIAAAEEARRDHD